MISANASGIGYHGKLEKPLGYQTLEEESKDTSVTDDFLIEINIFKA
jgi:hypothetical protein